MPKSINSTSLTLNTSEFQSENANHEHSPNSQVSSIVEERRNNSNRVLVAHLNIYSVQNKFEELKMLNDSLKAHVLAISETKIDRSYPNSQFSLHGYQMYRKDRKKEGKGRIADCIYFYKHPL